MFELLTQWFSLVSGANEIVFIAVVAFLMFWADSRLLRKEPKLKGEVISTRAQQKAGIGFK
jgi:hypothetical protein